MRGGVEVKACGPDELLPALTPVWHYFGATPTPESSMRIARFIAPGRAHAARMDGEVVGGASAFSFELTVPGARLPSAGVAAVAALPTHRRRGILRSLMRAQLDDVHERGEPLAVLWASDERIYGRYGYGVASLAGEMNLPRVRASLRGPAEPVGQARLVSLEEARAAFPDIYERVAAETPGMYARSEDWWDLRVLADPPERRAGGGELVRVLVEIGGRPEGYALYRIHQSFEHGFSIGHARVLEAMGTSADATREVWRVLLGVDWVDRITASLLPIDHALFFLLEEPRRMTLRVGDGLWLRLVDVGAALGARSYRDGAQVVLDVQDDFCPWNAGRWKVDAANVGRSDEEPDVHCDVSELGSVFLGGFTFAQLAAAGRARELRARGLARADALFRTDRAPWCPEIF